MPASDIGLEEITRQLDEDAPARYDYSPCLKIIRLLVGIAVELVKLVAQRANREMMHDVLQPPGCDVRLEDDPVVNGGG